MFLNGCLIHTTGVAHSPLLTTVPSRPPVIIANKTTMVTDRGLQTKFTRNHLDYKTAQVRVPGCKQSFLTAIITIQILPNQTFHPNYQSSNL